MPPLSHRVAKYIHENDLLKAGDRVAVAVSGGADSVALLRVLLELRSDLGIVLSAVHFNHQLRGPESDADEKFVASLVTSHGLEFHCASGDVAALAAEKHLSLETAARKMRYQYFRKLLEADVSHIATAHTLDDQAETVLLKLVRGAGTRGLAGIYPKLAVEGRRGSIIRPFLATKRAALEAYLSTLGQEWREDASNRDLRHSRNRVRHGILPRLEHNLNPAVREVLAETAEIARAEEDYWREQVGRILPLLWSARTAAADTAGLNLEGLMQVPLALRRRVLRAASETLGLRLEFHHVRQIFDLAAGSEGKEVELPGGWVISRHPGELRFNQRAGPGLEKNTADYEYQLPVPGRVQVPELGMWMEALVIPGGGSAAYNPEHSLDSSLLAKELRVRNWRAGDRFRPAHTRTAKKVKELLQERHVTGRQRQLWPVVVSGAEVIWLRGFSCAAEKRAPQGAGKAVIIREVEG